MEGQKNAIKKRRRVRVKKNKTEAILSDSISEIVPIKPIKIRIKTSIPKNNKTCKYHPDNRYSTVQKISQNTILSAETDGMGTKNDKIGNKNNKIDSDNDSDKIDKINRIDNRINNDESADNESKNNKLKNQIIPIDTFFTFTQNKKNGNYSIYDSDAKRIQLRICNVYIPFGVEYYNRSNVMQIHLASNNNYHHNTILLIKDYDTKLGCATIGPHGEDLIKLTYYGIINDVTDTNKCTTYRIRTYLKTGVRITHARGDNKKDYGHDDVVKKRCNVDIELGSFWMNATNYGCTVYVSSIEIT